MTYTEWKAAAQYDGFDEIMAVPVSDGWHLVGHFLKSTAMVKLLTKRGQPRVFASLDTIARYLKSIDVSQFNVYQVVDGDLFS